MLNNPIKLRFLSLLLLCMPLISLAQTQQWRLIWDQNKEDDISHYRIFRGNSNNPTEPFATVNYPDTVFTDNNLTPGTRYFYRITAVDNENLESDYSDNVDAAIPVVDIPNQVMNQGGSVQIALDTCVNDPDGSADQITWEFGNTIHLNFELDAEGVVTISSPDTSWLGEVSFTATDQDEFFDQKIVWFTVNALPVCDAISDQLQQQGLPFDPIILDDYVYDPDQADSLLVWEIGDAGDLEVSLDAQHHLKVSHPDNFTDMPAEDQWYGVETILIKVSDPIGASDSVWVKFDVNAKPQITSTPLTNIQAKQDFRYELLVQDPDSVQTLTVDWLDFPSFLTVTSSRVLEGKPEIPDTGQYPIRVRVLDSRGGQDIKEFTLDVQFTPGTPQIAVINSQTIQEGETFTPVSLNDYILNMDEQDSINWSASGQTELIVDIDNSSMATIGIPDVNWYGQEQITFKVTNSRGLSAQQSIVFKVEGVNDAPQIFGLRGQKIYQNDQFDIIDLSSFASDVDDSPATLSWSVSGNHNLDIVPLDATRFQVTPKVADWYGSEILVIQVSDPGGLSDQISVTYEIGKSIYSPFSTRFINSGTIVEVTWNTELAAIGTIQFGTNNFDRVTDPEPRQNKSHSIILSGLDSKTEYRFRALSKDSSGYKHISGIQSLTTGLAGEISVFPNPYRAGAHPENDVIHFANLPEGTTVSIFNLLGEPIFNIQDQSDLFRWDAKNNQQKDVQSGLYIYLLKDADNRKIESGKIVIIR